MPIAKQTKTSSVLQSVKAPGGGGFTIQNVIGPLAHTSFVFTSYMLYII